MARSLLISVAALLIVAVAALWWLPGVLEWERYRGTIEVLAGATIGEPVSIKGPIRLALLPEPMLSAGQIDVGGSRLSVAALQVRLALGPLLAGRVDAREITFEHPVLHLPWPLQPGTLTARPPSWLTDFHARIEDGTLAVGNLVVTGIDATLSTGDTGALGAAGTGRLFGRNWRFTGRLTSPGADGAAGLDFAVDGLGAIAAAGAAFSGQIAGDGALAGQVRARTPDLSALIPAPHLPFTAEGRITASSGLAAADDLSVQLGPSAGHAALALRVSPAPRLDIALSTSEFDLDPWVPVLAHHTATGLPIGLDLSAEAASLAGGRLRRLRGAADFGPNGITVREFAAVLPGDATLRANGRVSRKDDQPRFEGTATLDAPALHATFEWLKNLGLAPLAKLPEGAVREARVQGRVLATGGRFAFDDLKGEVDGAQVSGTFGVIPGQHPAIAATLAMDRLVVDPWLPATPPASVAAVAEALAGFSADLRLTARQARIRSATIENLGLDAATQEDGLTVRRIEGTVRGVHATASARISRQGRIDDAKLSASTAEVSSVADLLPAGWRASPGLWQGPASLELEASGPPSALAGKFVLAMADASAEADPTVDLGTGSWHGTLTLRHPGAPRFIATLGLFGWLGWHGAPTWLGDGSLSLIAQLSGEPSRLTAEHFDLNAGLLRASGHLALAMQPAAEPRLEGTIKAETLPLPMPRPRSQDPLPVSALRGWQAVVHVDATHVLAGLAPVLDEASFDTALEDGTLQIKNLKADVAGGRVTGSVRLTAGAELPTLTVDGNVVDATIDGPLAGTAIDLTAGKLQGETHLVASGHSPAALLATLAGNARFSVTDGAVAGFDLARLKAEVQADPAQVQVLREALGGGTTQFDHVDVAAELKDGRISFTQATLTAPAGTASLRGSVDLGAGLLDARVALHPAIPEPPEAGLSLTGPVYQPQRSPELTGFALWLAQHGPVATPAAQ